MSVAKSKKITKAKKPTTHHIDQASLNFWNIQLAGGLFHSDHLRRLIIKQLLSIHELQTQPVRRTHLTTYKISPLASLHKYYRRHRAIRHSLQLAVVLSLVIGAQLLYPNNRTLPLARLHGNGYVGFQNEAELLKRFDNFENRKVYIHTHKRQITTSYVDLGVRLDRNGLFNDLSHYSLKQRLIPFSFLFTGNKTFQVNHEISDPQMTLFVDDVVDESNKAPKNATVSIKNGKLTSTPSDSGYAYEKKTLNEAIDRSALANEELIVFAPTILNPKISTYEAESRVSEMQKRLQTPLTVRADGKALTFDGKTMARWLEIKPDFDTGVIRMSFNPDRVAASINSLAAQVNVAPQPTVITLLNGVEAGRNYGEYGKKLRMSDLVELVSNATAPGSVSVEGKVDSLPPTDTYERKYSRDSTGIQNLLDYWISNNPGQYGIDVRSLNGNISANYNQYGQFSSNGLNRIYVAHMVYGRINTGNLSNGTSLGGGRTVGLCIDRMLRYGDEGCTSALGDKIGWSANDATLSSQGFENTSLARGGGVTTANDTSDWFMKVLSGSILSSSQANNVISIMSGHSNRSGIPSGSSGVGVANSTSYSGTHDVAIVYHPNGTYMVSVLSTGGSPSMIADLSREIKKVFDQ